MSQKTKIIYLGILINIKRNAYQDNTNLLKQDLIILRKLLLIDKDNQKMQKLEKSMQLVLTRTR